MNNILILNTAGDDWTNRNLGKLPDVTVGLIYSPHSLPIRVIRRAHYRTSIGGKSVWYGNWKKHLNKYNVIIIIGALFGPEILKWIRNNGYKGRLILYYRDPQITSYARPDCHVDSIRRISIDTEYWTFEKPDAERYNMKYNPQFYFPIAEYSGKPEIDALYIGQAKKDRIQQINNMYRTLKEAKLKTKFIVFVGLDGVKGLDEGISTIRKMISYDDVIKYNRKTRAIVELNQPGQTGLTLRALESIFLNKKLITNNEAIKKMDFYNKDNILVNENNSPNELRDFILNTPSVGVPESVKDKYTAETWLRRFIEMK